MLSISATDLVALIPELSHLHHLQVIDPANAALILPFLKILGADEEYPIDFIASQHRNLQGKVVVSYILQWEIQINSSFLDSSFATAEDRIIAAGYRDLGMSSGMSAGQTACRSYGDAPLEGFPQDMVNSNEKEVLAQIEQLKELLVLARGNPYKNDGSRKLFDEANVVEQHEKRRKKRDKREQRIIDNDA